MIIAYVKDSNDLPVSSCTRCGAEFSDNDYTIFWHDTLMHMNCFVDMFENIDRDYGYILNNVIDLELLEDLFDKGININDRKERVMKMLRGFYTPFQMDKPEGD